MAWRRARALAGAARAAGAPLDLIGRDLAASPGRGASARSVVIGALVGALCGALLLAALRIEIQRQRYALAELIREERALGATSLELVVRVRALRDPKRLARLAASHGFVRPERVIDLSGPAGPDGPDGATP